MHATLERLHKNTIVFEQTQPSAHIKCACIRKKNFATILHLPSGKQSFNTWGLCSSRCPLLYHSLASTCFIFCKTAPEQCVITHRVARRVGTAYTTTQTCPNLPWHLLPYRASPRWVPRPRNRNRGHPSLTPPCDHPAYWRACAPRVSGRSRRYAQTRRRTQAPG